MLRSRVVVVLVVQGLALAGCANLNNTQNGALFGTGAGAVVGNLVGGASGRPGAGALIGAAAGGLTGGLVGNSMDVRDQRDAAVAHAQYERSQSQAMAQAVSDSDVIHMTRSGVSDDVIINALRTRGCWWSGSPDSVIALKQQGVSDRVIESMQNSGLRPTVSSAVPPPVVYRAPPPPPPVTGVVVVGGPGYYGPRPYWGPRPGWYGRPGYHHHW